MTDQVLDPGIVLPPVPRPSRRRFVLAVMMLATLAFALFALWYLITRKPISEIPGIDLPTLPTYSAAVYGVEDPVGIAVAPDGSRIYVTQGDGDRSVVVFDAAGTELGRLAPPAGTSTDHTPFYVAIQPQTGELFVADRLAGAVYVYDRDGAYLRTFDPPGDLADWQPVGIAIAPDGTIAVGDVGRGAVHLFSLEGVLLRSIAAGRLDFPNGLAFDRSGRLYVADGNHGRLVVFDRDGNELASVRRGAAANELGLPRGVAVDSTGRIYVVDTTAQGVQVYRALADGKKTPDFIGRFGVQGVGDGAFQYPNGVAVDDRGHIYVTDRLNGRIQVWSK